MLIYSSILVTHLNAQSSPESKTEIPASEQLIRASQLPKTQAIWIAIHFTGRSWNAITQSMSQLEGAIHTLPCRIFSGWNLEAVS